MGPVTVDHDVEDKAQRPPSAMKRCPHCGHANAVGAAFCGECGRSVATSRPCPACGFLGNPPEAGFCVKCGNLLRRRRSSVPYVWLGGLAVIVIVVVVLWQTGMFRRWFAGEGAPAAGNLATPTASPLPGAELVAPPGETPVAPIATLPSPTDTPTPQPTRAKTPTATSTSTPAPSPSPSPTVTPTREPVLTYHRVSLSAAGNATLDFESPPTGNTTLGGVPFQLSEAVFKSQASPSPDSAYPTSVLLEVNVPQAHRVHLLLNTGNGLNRFSGRTIGQVVAYCDGVAVPVTDLQLGRDVREWHASSNVVSTASRAQEVWTGALINFPNLTGSIDMLSLDLPYDCWDGEFTALEIIDSSASTVNSLDPALNLVGVTVEHYE
jgi:hypothetical protein